MGNIDSLKAGKVRGQLRRILESDEFSGSVRQSRLLEHIVRATLAYDNEALKARNIAVTVFERGSDFSSRSDSVVRIEAAKLRSKLEKYYNEHSKETVIISIPKGGYAAVFTLHQPQEVDAGEAVNRSDKSLSEGYNWTVLILPFGITGDPEKARQLGAGILNEISMNLTRFYYLNVIDHSFFCRAGDSELAEMRFNARFVLDGQVQVSGDTFKLWAILRDSKTKFNIWSDKFEGSLADSSEFDWQDRIAESIVYKIAGEFGIINKVRFEEFTKDAKNTPLEQKAFLLYDIWANSMAERTLEAALKTAEAAALVYPENMNLLAILADLIMSSNEYGAKTAEDMYERAFHIIKRVLVFSPGNQLANLLSSFYYFNSGNIGNFYAAAERAVEINPTNAHVLMSLSNCYGLLGKWDVALSYVDKVKKLNPAHPRWMHTTYALYHYMNGDYAAAYSEALEIYPSVIIWNPLIRLLCAGMQGHEEQARRALNDLLKGYPLFMENREAVLQRMTPDVDTRDRLRHGLNRAVALLGIQA